MNRSQFVAVIVAVVAVAAALQFPPYYDDGGILGGTVYFPFQKAPAHNYIGFNGWLLRWELGFVVLSLCGALVALRSSARARQRKCFAFGLLGELALLLWCVPYFPTILVPEFTWYGLNLLAFLLLGVVLDLGRGQDSAPL